MGMFDNIKREEIVCPHCKKGIIKDFQSKSGICHNLYLTEEELIQDAKRFQVDQPYYYGYCPECETRVDFEYIPGHWEQTYETQEERRKTLLGLI